MIRSLLKPLSFLPALLLMYMIFSFSAQPGEVLEYQSFGGAAQRATFVEAKWEVPAFEDAVPIAVRTWLNAEIMDGLYADVAQNAPVVFGF